MISVVINNSFIDNVTLYTKTATDEFNDKTYASSTILCKVCNTNELVNSSVSNSNGRTELCNTVVFSLTNIPLESYITYNGIKEYCVSTKKIKDRLGNVLYYKSYFK